MSTPKSDGRKISIKFLLSNGFTGSLIGTGGRAIKELMAETGARVHVSSNTEPYPGTSDRVVLISGDYDAVVAAQILIWEMIALVTSAEQEKQVEWSPKAMSSTLGQNDAVEVSAKLTIPAAAGGLILGRGGASIRTMAEESGAKILMSGKDEALFTQERVLSISGGAAQCIKCTELLLQKLNEQQEVIPYVNRSTSYSTPINNPYGMGMGMPMAQPYGGYPNAGGYANGGMKRNYGGNNHSNNNANNYGHRRGNNGYQGGSELDNNSNGFPVGEGKITLPVPSEQIGNIFGKQGVTMREIISLSGAKIVVSGKDEFIPGTTNRLVTITGPPVCTQNAHLLISQRLLTPANPYKKHNNSNGNNSNASRND